MRHPVRQLLCWLMCLCLLPVLPAQALGAAIASDAALEAKLESVLRGRPVVISVTLQPGYKPYDYSATLWQNGVSTYVDNSSGQDLLLTDIVYYPDYTVCFARLDVNNALLVYKNARKQDFRLFLSESLRDRLFSNQAAVLNEWKTTLGAESWTLSWTETSRQLHVSNVVYASPAAATATPKSASTVAPTKAPTKKPTAVPTKKPTATPTKKPTSVPTKRPTATPRRNTGSPTKAPTPTPTRRASAGSGNGLYDSPDGPRITTREQFASAFDAHISRGETSFDLYLNETMMKDVVDHMDGWVTEVRSNCGTRYISYRYYERTGQFHVNEVEHRVALRILRAWKTGDTSALTAREKQTLTEAQRIVNAAPQGAMARERYLHDYLCDKVTYYTNSNDYEEKDQAIGALLNGKADCDGYSEAFYLLCNMAGIPARFQHGDTYEKNDQYDATHMWNLVQIYGNWVMVDVTWDDSEKAGANYYLYYNIGTKRAAETHTWEKDLVPVDWVKEAGNGVRPAELAEGHAASMSAAESLIREAFITRHAASLDFTFANGMDLERDIEQISNYIYATGVKEYSYKFGGHSIGIIPTAWYTEYGFAGSDAEALAYIQKMKNAGKREFTLFLTGSYGRSLFKNELAGYHLLEGRFGIKDDKMLYNADCCRASYSNVVFYTNFKVCKNETEILDYLSELAAKKTSSFAICVPGDYGSRLFRN